MAIDLQVEKMRLAEVTSARDSAVQRLSSAYDSIKEKALAIGRLEAEKAELEHRLADADTRTKEAVEYARAEERRIMEDEMLRLREAIRSLNENAIELRIKSPNVDVLPDAQSTGTPFTDTEELSKFTKLEETTQSIERVFRFLA